MSLAPGRRVGGNWCSTEKCQKNKVLFSFFQPHAFIFYKSTKWTVSSSLTINIREQSQKNLISEAHLMSRVHAATWDHLRSLIQPAAMMVHVTTRNHVDICGLSCHQTTDPTLMPDVMLMPLYGQSYYRKLYWSPWCMSPMKVIWCLRPCWYALSILLPMVMLIPVVFL